MIYPLRRSVHTDLYSLLLFSSPSPQTPGSDDYLSSNQHLSLTSASQTSLNLTLNNRNNIIESSSISLL
ncbi:unnamed protein product [Adineta steineri]|uniref:Uncharacterized protein n=1 Tax=Adineta steineri TaxID=433720 RepID=A0A820ML20_9BILA|nr:unnamed protein product [Adineta steineri]